MRVKVFLLNYLFLLLIDELIDNQTQCTITLFIKQTGIIVKRLYPPLKKDELALYLSALCFDFKGMFLKIRGVYFFVLGIQLILKYT